MERIELPTLEYHLAHGCNLSCQQCSHYSNFHVAGKLPTIDEADAAYPLWSHRLRPMRFALLGGEPLLNPAIIQHIQLARQHWADSELMLVTNGFMLHRFPELPAVLRETRCRLEVSQHGAHDEYLRRFRNVKELAWRWRKQYRRLKVRIRRSHLGWMRQYNVVDGKPLPFNSDHVAAHQVCMQRTCTQLVNGCLAKCPALAYWPKLEANALCTAIFCVTSSHAAEEKPNILLIIADEMGYSHITCFGGEVQTPPIDALAKTGIGATNFYVAPTCSPTRSMLLSGCDHHVAGFGNMEELVGPKQKGQPGYEGHLNERVVPVAKVLREAGYHTYCAGKLHIGYEPSQWPAAMGLERDFALLQGGGSNWSDMTYPNPAHPHLTFTLNGNPAAPMAVAYVCNPSSVARI